MTDAEITELFRGVRFTFSKNCCSGIVHALGEGLVFRSRAALKFRRGFPAHPVREPYTDTPVIYQPKRDT